MKELNEILRILRKRSKQFEHEGSVALTDELETIYRAKAEEAYSIYVIVYNIKMKLLKERAENADAEADH